jgi:hypothetical protein
MKPNPVNDSRAVPTDWLIMPKVLYFWLNMAIYTATSFITKFFMAKWSLSEFQIAFMMSLQISIFFGAMFWTNLVDRIRQPRKVLMTAVIGYAVFFSCLALPIFTRPDQGTHRLIYSSVILAFTWTCSSCFYPIVDTTILNLLEKNPNFTKDHYNNQRLWGVPGHVIGISLSGWVFSKFGIIGYEVVVLLSTITFSVVAWFTMPEKLAESRRSEAKDSSSIPIGDSASTLKINPTWTLLSDPSFLFFCFVGLSGGILRSTLTNFQTHHMEKTFKMDSFWASLTAVPRIGSEIGVYLFAKKLIQYIGLYWMLLLSLMAGMVRVFGYAYAPSHGYWKYLPFFLEIPKGLNSGLLVTSSVRIASDIAPPGCASSAQGLFSGIYTGLSMFVGGNINGVLLYISGNDLKFMFKWVGYLVLTCTAMSFAKYGFIDRSMKLPFVKSRSSY